MLAAGVGWLWIVIVIAVVVGLAWYFMRGRTTV